MSGQSSGATSRPGSRAAALWQERGWGRPLGIVVAAATAVKGGLGVVLASSAMARGGAGMALVLGPICVALLLAPIDPDEA